MAQNLPDSVVADISMSPEDKDQMKAFIARQAGGLMGDGKAINKAKNALAAPLNNTNASESFRREYGTQLLPVLTPLATDPREEVAINALRLAGVVGTPDGLALALRGLDDKRPSVRMMAAMSAGLAISTGRVEKNRAISPRNATDALETLNGKLQAEKDPRVLDAMMLGLDDAMHVKNGELEGVRKKATGVLLANAGRLARDKAAPPALDNALAHAAKTLGEALLETGADKLANPDVQEAAGVAGDVVAAIVRRLDAGLTDAERNHLGLTAQQSERIVQQAAAVLGGKASVYNLDELLRDGKDAEFRAAAQRMFRELQGEPFNRKTPADRYPAQP